MNNSIIKKKQNIKPQIMKTTIKRPQGFEKSLQELLSTNGISIEVFKYKNFRITKTPNQKYPEMVTITRCTSNLKSMLGRSFINPQKSMVFIDYQMSKYKIENRRWDVEKQLISIGIGNYNW